MLFWHIALSIDTGVLENHWRIVWNYYYRFRRSTQAENCSTVKENICEDAMKAVSKIASDMSFQGAQRFTVNYGIIQIGLLVTVHGTLPLIAYLVFPSHFVVSFINCSLAN